MSDRTNMNADIGRYRNNLRDEMNGAALYTALAAAEPYPLRRDLFQQLAEADGGQTRRLEYFGPRRARNRPHGTWRQPLERRCHLVRFVLCGRHIPGGTVCLDDGSLGHRGECRRERSGTRRRGNADLTLQRPQCLVLGGQATGIRLPRGWSDLRS